MTIRALCVLLLAMHASAWAQNNPVDPARVLDTFDQLAAWQAGASDGVRASIQKASGPEGPALRLDFDLAYTRGRFTDFDPAGNFIPGAPAWVASGGATFGGERGWFGALRGRYFGPRPLIEDDSVRSQASLIFNARAVLL